jgi:heptosyltransferase-2
MNILVRLPNWLGDMVLSTAFVKALAECYPGATVDLIAKKSLAPILDHFPAHGERFLFDKAEYGTLGKVYAFGRDLGRRKAYEFYFCLPDSFSTALMGFGTGARKRIGYRKELRSPLLTHAYDKKKGLHRADEYQGLLHQFLGHAQPMAVPELRSNGTGTRKGLVVNINSEAQSRRLPADKAVTLLTHLREQVKDEIILTGSPQEKEHVDSVFSRLPVTDSITNLAGQGNLGQLVSLLSSVRLLISTDSGPAHVANALGTPSVVLFGAGDEHHTGPYDRRIGQVLRLGQLPCEPCRKNTCTAFDQPECLLRLDEKRIISLAMNTLS